MIFVCLQIWLTLFFSVFLCFWLCKWMPLRYYLLLCTILCFSSIFWVCRAPTWILICLYNTRSDIYWLFDSMLDFVNGFALDNYLQFYFHIFESKRSFSLYVHSFTWIFCSFLGSLQTKCDTKVEKNKKKYD